MLYLQYGKHMPIHLECIQGVPMCWEEPVIRHRIPKVVRKKDSGNWVVGRVSGSFLSLCSFLQL